MKLIVSMVDAAGGRRVLESMTRQGLPAVLVWSDATPLGGGRVTLLVGAHDHDVTDVCTAIASIAVVTESTTQTLMPLADPTDLVIGRPPMPGLSDSGMYVLRVSRFEQIW